MISRHRLALIGLYSGGFLGPFGGAVTVSMLPELGTEFGVSAAAASASITAYLIPFAGLMLVSGTLGVRWGIQRSVRVAYLLYVVSSLLCAVAGPFSVFLAGRALQGAANAFTTPLLMATIAAATPPARLGRALGLLASVQAAGATTAPLLGGLAAEVTWRLAFLGPAVVAVLLAAAGLPGDGPARRPGRLRDAWRSAVLRPAVVALIAWACLGGLSFLVAFRTEDAFGLSAGERGALLTGFGALGMLSAQLLGRTVDRFGSGRATTAGVVAAAVPIALIGLLPSLPSVAVLWAAAGVCAQLIMVGLNTTVLSGGRDNRTGNAAGAVSVVQSFRFIGAALSPVAFTPIYHASAAAGFLVPAVLLLGAGGLSAISPPTQTRPDR